MSRAGTAQKEPGGVRACGGVVTWGCEAGARAHHIDSSLVLETGQGGFWDREEAWGLETSSAREAPWGWAAGAGGRVGQWGCRGTLLP